MTGHLKDNLFVLDLQRCFHSTLLKKSIICKKRNDPEGHISHFFAFTFDTVLFCFFF